MGKRGPAPTPSDILRLRGSWRGAVNKDEPKPEKGAPECPDWLDDYAKEAWSQLVPLLEAMGVLTKIDGHALAILCQTWARWRKAEEFIEQNGEVYPVKDADGRVRFLKRFPQVATAESCARTLNRFMSEFGLTPSARSRIAAPKHDADDTDGKSAYLTVG
jgi:P27 family predicted phage terminase small subunit